MSDGKIRLLAVDLDGTLVDSAPDIAHCLGRALEAVGCTAPGEARTRVWIGDGLEILLARALAYAVHGDDHDPRLARDGVGTQLHKAALVAFLECYRENLFVRSRLYPNAIETLDELRGRGVKLCCITNKRVSFSEELLRLAAVRDRFLLLLGGDSLPEKKPSPLPLETAARELEVAASAAAIVGDSHQDLRAARAAGFSFIWASYGYCALDPEELGNAPRIAHFAELRAAVGH